MKSMTLACFLFASMSFAQTENISITEGSISVSGTVTVSPSFSMPMFSNTGNDLVFGADGSVYFFSQDFQYPTAEGQTVKVTPHLKAIGASGQLLWEKELSEFEGYFMTDMVLSGNQILIQMDQYMFIAPSEREPYEPPVYGGSLIAAFQSSDGAQRWSWNFPCYPWGMHVAENGTIFARYLFYGFASFEQHLVAIAADGAQLYDIQLSSDAFGVSQPGGDADPAQSLPGRSLLFKRSKY